MATDPTAVGPGATEPWLQVPVGRKPRVPARDRPPHAHIDKRTYRDGLWQLIARPRRYATVTAARSQLTNIRQRLLDRGWAVGEAEAVPDQGTAIIVPLALVRFDASRSTQGGTVLHRYTLYQCRQSPGQERAVFKT